MRIWRLSCSVTYLIVGLWLTLAGASARAGDPTGDLSAGVPPLAWKAAFVRDPGGRMTLAEVTRLPDSALLPLGDTLSLGFTRDIVWVRMDIHRPNEELPHRWWLELDQTVIEDAILYAANAAGGWTTLDRLGHREPLFVLHMDETGVHRLWLRLATRTSMSTRLVLWHPQAKLEADARANFLWGGLFGAYLLVAVFYLAFGAWTRERIHLVYTAYVLGNVVASLLTGGWPAQFLPGVDSHLWVDLLGISLSLSVVIATYFSIAFLRIDQRWKRLSRLLMYAAVFTGVAGVAGSIAGRYDLVAPGVQMTTIVIILLTLGMTVQLAREGRGDARMFLLAFSVYYVGVAWRYARNFGLLEPGFWNDNSYQIGAFIHIMVMSTAIFSGYTRLRREKEAAEARASLESDLRAEQRDFTSMVSHEFRTPLSIIGASADNLLQSPELQERSRQRVEKILKASARMTALMDKYLARERQLLDHRPLELAPVDLAVLCNRVALDLAESEDHAVEVIAPGKCLITCDAGLIEIAMRNLTGNALRHSPATEAVTLEVTHRPDGVTVEVRDHGPGIPSDELPHIFERFFRGRGALDQPGAGLGLHLVRSIADRHGGRVSVHNLDGGGCAFRLWLPG